MAKFKYRIMNLEGQKIDGTYEAESKNEVINYISGNGYYPLLVEEIIESKSLEIKFNQKVRNKDLAVFCRQFYTMLDAGVPILTCLEILSSQIVNAKLRKATKEVKEEVESGGVLSDAMKKHTDVFPEFLVSLVGSGEASGNLDAIMLRMSTYYEKESKISNKVSNAMVYPMALSMVAVAAVVFILTYVMPTFIDIFEGSGSELPWSTKFLINISEGIKENWFYIIILIMLLIIGIKIYLRTDQGKVLSSKLKLKLPIIRKLNEMIIVSRFTRTLSTLIASGLPLINSLQIVAGVSGNKMAEKALIKIKDSVMQGENLYTSMKESKIFPEMLYSMVKIGEESGALDDILNKTADFYDEELDSAIQRAVTFLEPMLIVVMGLVIGFIVISIMLPMFDSYSKI